VAAFLLARTFWNRTKKSAATVGKAAKNGMGFLKKTLLLAGVAVIGAFGYNYYKKNTDNADTKNSKPKETGQSIAATGAGKMGTNHPQGTNQA
jgi:hypothetical protein